ncbi:hypothetical protein FZ983_27500 [Azospirillum sp. B21]|uniref:hypothetical protein n=1 Tax=Azospirillum sp. B21 TaxID=2607496 RepID=UPI0011EF8463|nr:hypothetical protein [Azospirillum sp. B21]KAA0574647.1 hypothetical protein FZ983_27500 [Azospirillum sp. B21]
MSFPRSPAAVVAFARTIPFADALRAQSGQLLEPLDIVAGMPLVDGSALLAVRCSAVAERLYGLVNNDVVYVAVRLFIGARRARLAGCHEAEQTLVYDHVGNVQSLPTGIVMMRTLYDARSLAAQAAAWGWDERTCDSWRRAIERAETSPQGDDAGEEAA